MLKPICPHCQIPLSRRINDGVFQYACNKCLGFAVHIGGLKKVITPSQLENLVATAKQSPVGEVNCSHCSNKTYPVYTGHYKIELDYCEYCELVWLDTGEWGDLGIINKPEPHNEKYTNTHLEYGKILLAMDNERQKTLDTYNFSVEPTGEVSGWRAFVAVLGIPVPEESGPFKAFPLATFLIIGICIIVSFLCFKHMDVAIKSLSYTKNAFRWSEGYRLSTSFFVHGDILHLIGNMVFLMIFGPAVEDHLGKVKFIFLLYLSHIAGTLVFGMTMPNEAWLVGASGGIAGVLGYFFFRFPRRKFYIFIRTMMVMRMGIFVVPAWAIGLLFLGREAFELIKQRAGVQDGVAHLSHLVGFVVGVIFWFFTKTKTKEVDEN